MVLLFSLLFVLAAVAGCVVFACFAIGNGNRARLIKHAEPRKIDRLRKGMAKVKGRLIAREKLLISPLSKIACVYFRFIVKELRTYSVSNGRTTTTSSRYVTVIDHVEAIKTTVQDSTGEADIDLNDAEVVCNNTEDTSQGTFQNLPPRLERTLQRKYGFRTTGLFMNKSLRVFESVLTNDAKVVVVGEARLNRDDFPRFVKDGMPLLVSDKGTQKLVEHYSWRCLWWWVASGAAAAAAVVFLIFGITMQYRADNFRAQVAAGLKGDPPPGANGRKQEQPDLQDLGPDNLDNLKDKIPVGKKSKLARVAVGDLFAFIEKCTAANQLAGIDVRGPQFDNLFQDAHRGGALLVGFEINGGNTIKALRPIFRGKDGSEILGPWHGTRTSGTTVIKAKPGYVVGTISIRTGLSIDGLSVKFTKLGADRLIVADNYTSQWVGGKGGGPSTIGQEGTFNVGICGYAGKNGSLTALGLIAVTEGKDLPPGKEPMGKEQPADKKLTGKEKEQEPPLAAVPTRGGNVSLGSFDQAIEYLKSGNQTKTLIALHAFEKTKVYEPRHAQVAAECEKLMKGGDGLVALAAASALGTWATKEQIPTLVRALDDPSPFIRDRALKALGATNDEQAVAPICRFLSKFGHDEHAVKSLVGMGPMVENEVRKNLKHEDARARDNAARVLKLIGKNGKDDAFIAALAALGSKEKMIGVNWFAKNSPATPEQHAEGGKALAALLVDDTPFVKGGAARALEKWATKDQVDALVHALNSKPGLDEVPLSRALARFADPRAVSVFAGRLSGFQGEAAVKALILIGPAAENGMIECLNHQHYKAKAGACRVLGEIGTQKSLEPLQKARDAALKNMYGGYRDVADAADAAIRAIEKRK